MYWPEEVPAGIKDGGETIEGRQPYHGEHELIASNHCEFGHDLGARFLASKC